MRTFKAARAFVVIFEFFLWTHLVFGQSNTDLVAAYAFEEGTGTTTADASGNRNDGTLQGATWTANGKFGKAASFNGSNSWITVNDSNSLDLTTAMTLEAWVYPTSNQSGWRSIMQKETDAYFLTASSDNGPLQNAGGGTFNGNVANTISPTGLPANNWSHVAVTYDGANLRLYVNGSQVSSRSQSGTIQMTTSALRIGGNSVYGEYFEGYIDEARIYSRALTQAQIQTDMTTPIVGTGSTLPTVSSLACTSSSVNAGSNTTCTVNLSKAAPSGGSVVSLSDNSAALSEPSSVTVGSGATSATFTATTSSVNVDKAVTVTATYNSTSKTATVTVVAPITLSSVGCSASSLQGGLTTTCTVALNKGAPSGGAVVTLSDNSSFLSLPSSVTVASGATSATFTASSSVVTLNKTVTITASYSGTSKKTTVTLTPAPPPVTLSSVGCSASSLQGGLTTTCTVALNQGAPSGGTVVTLSDNSSFLSLPSSVTVASGATSATFIATSSVVTLNQTVTITASYGGTSKTTTVTLTPAPPPDPVLTLSSASAAPGSTVSLNLTLSYPSGSAPAGLEWTLSYSASAFTSVTMTAGPALTAAGKTLTCTSRTGSYECIATGMNTNNIGTGVVAVANVGLSSSSTSSAISVVSTSAVSGTGSSITISGASGTITATGLAVPQNITKRLTTGSAVASKTEDRSDAAAGYSSSATLARLDCNPRIVYAGEETTCQMQLDSAQAAGATTLEIASSSGAVKVPPAITTRAGQSILTFRASTDPAASQEAVTLEARLGDSTVQESISILPQDKPVLRVPQAALARFDTPVRFTVEAAHSGGLPVQLSAEGLPPGGSFAPETGVFEWTPSRAQQGSYDIAFTAATAASSATRHTTIEVGTGEPVLSGSEAASCSPSAVARLRGKWLSLAASTASDRSGNSMVLGGTRVKVNQEYVPVLYASSTELSVLCPHLSPGAGLQIAVETESGESQPVTTTMQEATPMLLTLEESSPGQALIAVSGSGQLAMVRNFKVNAQPAQPNDAISVWATGLGAPQDRGSVQIMVKVGDISVTADSVQSLAGFAGIQQVEARVPSGTMLGEAVPVQIEILRANGQSIRSNTATIAIESIQP